MSGTGGTKGTNGLKWYETVLTVLLIVVFAPLIILLLPVAALALTREYRRTKKAYKASPYYAAYGQKFSMGVTASPEYRLYNGAAERKLPIRFNERVDGLFCFSYDGAVYLLPNFEQMGLSEDGRGVWQVSYDGDRVDFGEDYAAARVQPTYPDRPVRFLVERSMITECDLTKTPPPACVCVTQSYETAFENEDAALKMRIPQTTEDLYAMMKETPDLCGEFELTEDQECIRWRVREDIQITLGVDLRDCYAGVDKLLLGKFESGITHWHPTCYEIYNEVCSIGLRGHVLVLREGLGSGAVLYSGRKEDCPYQAEKKILLGKYYYIEMR